MENKRDIKKYLISTGKAIVLPVFVLVCWQFFAVSFEATTMLPRVDSVFSVLMNPFADILGKGSLIFHIGISCLRVLIGFSLGAIVAIPIGFAMGLSEKFRGFVYPFIEILRPLCPVAWIPFAVMLLGGTTISNVFGKSRPTGMVFDYIQIAQLFILAWGAFFPIVINTFDGVTRVKSSWIETGTIFGLSRFGQVSKIIFPASLPQIFTGLKTGIGISWVVVVAAEMFPGQPNGIGYIMIDAYSQTEIHITAAGLIAVGIVGFLLHKLLSWVQRAVCDWPGKEK